MLQKSPTNEFLTNSSNQNINDNIDDMLYQNEGSSSKLNTNEQNTITPTSYIERLEHKIQEQAKRLNDLTKYKCLCEKRLLQSNPEEQIPITEQSIKNASQDKKNSKTKYNELYDKYTKLLKDFNALVSSGKADVSVLNNTPVHHNNNDVSNISDDNVNSNYKEEDGITEKKYKKLKHKNKELEEEKNKIIELLRQETLNNEEQKNLIAILQQTIDNDLIKNETINQYLTHDNVIGFAKLKNEVENYRRQLVLSQALVNSLKAEIDHLNRTNKKQFNTVETTEENNNNIIGNNNTITNTNENDHLLEENIKLKTKITSQTQIINNLSKENSDLKTLINEAENKINQNYNINSETSRRVINLENDINS